MAAAADSDDHVRVRRLTVDCGVARDHPDPPAVRGRLDAAAGRLGMVLAELLAPLAGLGDEIIAIRRLELGFDLDTSLPPDALARAWAGKIAAAVAAWLRPDAHASMVRFPDQAHYLARYLADSVGGAAAERWYYRRWDGIAALALPARLRAALVEVPAGALAALAALPASELATVLAALGPREARRVVLAIVAERAPVTGDPGAIARAARALAPEVAAWLPVARALPSAWQAALALAARAFAALEADDVPAAVALAAALAATERDPQLRAGAAPSGAAILDGAGLPSPEPLLALTAADRRALLAPLAPLGAATETPAAPATWYSRLGGLLLLLPRIAELPLDEVFGDDAPLARLHVLARAAGAEHRAEVLADPLWRELCGVERDDDGPDPSEWSPPAALADEFAAALWRRGAGRARELAAIVTRHDQPLLAIAGEPDGDWLALTALTPALRTALRGTPGPAELPDGLPLAARVSLAAGRDAARMLAWLAPELAAAVAPAELALTLAAQQALRAFARRLPGFAASSPRFLFDSFLDFDATVIATDGVFHCRVGRPRLAALFGLTGALRGRLAIGGGRAVELYPA